MILNIKSTISKILVLTIILGSIACMFTGVLATAETASSSVVFSDSFDNGLGDWVVANNGATVSGGKLNLATGENSTVGYAQNIITRPDNESRKNQSVTVEVTCAEFAAGKLPAIWLRVQEDANGVKSGYALIYDKKANVYGIWINDTNGNKKLLNGSIKAIAHSYFGGTAKDDTYKVTFSATGTNPTVLSIHTEFETINWVRDDYTVIEDSTTLYQNAGTVGLSAISSTENDVVALDNFKYTSSDIMTDVNVKENFDKADTIENWDFALNGASISDGKLNIKTGSDKTAGYTENLVTRKATESRTDQSVTIQVSTNEIAAGKIPAIWLRVSEDVNGKKSGYVLVYDRKSNYFGVWHIATDGTAKLLNGAFFRIAYSYFGGNGANDTYNITFSATGTYPTVITASAYFSKNTSWVTTNTVEDSTKELQTSGTVGLSVISATENDSIGIDSFVYNGTGALTKVTVNDEFDNGIGDWEDPSGLAKPEVTNGKMQFNISGSKLVSDYYIRRPLTEGGINQSVSVDITEETLTAGNWPTLFLRVQNADTTSPVGYFVNWDGNGGTICIGKSVANSDGTITYTALKTVHNFRKVSSANIVTLTFNAEGDGKTTDLTATVKQWNTETDYKWAVENVVEGDTTQSLQGTGTVALTGLEKATAETSVIEYEKFSYIMDDSVLNEKEEEPEEIVIDYPKYINYRQSLANTYSKLTNDKKLNIVYYGGSVTHGTGASDPEKYSWRAKVGNWFVENFPDAEINNMSRAAGESGTYLGSFRVERDILSAQPDLLFIEYSINDYYAHATYERAAYQYETIIRKVKEAYPECDIVCVLVTDENLIDLARKGTLHEQAQAHEDMSVKYNIPTIHVGRAISSIFSDGWTASDWDEYSTDIVHLTDKGYEIYYSVLKEYLEQSLLNTVYDGKITIPELPELQSDRLLDGNVTVIQPTAELVARSEELGGKGFEFHSGLYGSMQSSSYYGSLKGSNIEGAEFVLEFDGTELVSHLTVTNSSRQFYVKVDNGEYELKNFASLNPTTIVAGLPSGKHTVRFKPAYNENFTGMWIVVFYSRDEAMQTVKHDGVTDVRDLVRLKQHFATNDVLVGSYMDYDKDNHITSGDMVQLIKNLLTDTKDEFLNFKTDDMEKTGNTVFSNVYTDKTDNTVVRYLSLGDKKTSENTAYITMMADSHISDSFRPENAQYVENGLKYAKNADMVVMLGDNVNSSTNDGSVDTLKKIVWDKYPNNICVFGNHELEYATDKAAQREVLEEIWPHNTVYCKKIVKEKLYLIGMDNASESFSFTEKQCEMLEADIKEARETGATIILLQHISPVALDNSLGANAQMAEILANNGDIIKAVFSGHNHMDSLDYVDSCYETADGKIVETSIPCYRLMSSKYDEEKNNYGANVLVLAVNF